MAGFGAAHAAHEAGVRPVMYDMHDHIGGHTASYEFPGGWTFDEGPHVSFTEDARIRDLLASNVDGKYEEFATRVNNYWKGHWIKHPAQINLHGLPTDLVTKILLEFVEVAQRTEPPSTVRNYEDWLRASFGKTFSETFPMEYTIKYHTTTAANMNTEWIGPRLYRPKLEEVFRGALQPSSRRCALHQRLSLSDPRRVCRPISSRSGKLPTSSSDTRWCASIRRSVCCTSRTA